MLLAYPSPTHLIHEGASESIAEQLGMGSGAHEIDLVALHLIDQQEVTADMAFPVIGPVALQGVVQPFGAKGRIVGNEQQHRLLEPAWADLLERTSKKTRRSTWDHYYDPIVHDSMLVHLVARHFPARLTTLPPTMWTRTAEMLRDGWYNSLSSASMLLAIDAYYNAVSENVKGKFNVNALDRLLDRKSVV